MPPQNLADQKYLVSKIFWGIGARIAGTLAVVGLFLVSHFPDASLGSHSAAMRKGIVLSTGVAILGWAAVLTLLAIGKASKLILPAIANRYIYLFTGIGLSGLPFQLLVTLLSMSLEWDTLAPVGQAGSILGFVCALRALQLLIRRESYSRLN